MKIICGLFFLFALTYCNIKIVTPEQAMDYNNNLIGLWGKTMQLDLEIDHDFYENYYSLHSTTDSTFVEFVKKRKEDYLHLQEELDNVDNLSTDNEMKTKFKVVLQYMSNGLDNYYSILLKTPENEKDSLQSIVNNYNTQFKKLQADFLQAQQNLAKKYDFKLSNN